MVFIYQLIQLSPGVLRDKIKVATGSEKKRLISALFIRDISLLAFAIVYIMMFAKLFGNDNSSVGVASFCMLLSLRFVGYGYYYRDSLTALILVLVLMGVNGYLVTVLPVGLMLLIHGISLLLILRLTTQNPQYGNGGVYTFGYVLVTGMPVPPALIGDRFLSLGLALLICGMVLWRNHRQNHFHIRGHHVVFKLDFHDAVFRWQLRLAVGVASALAIGQLMGINRPMWLGFAAMSVLLPQTTQLFKRAITRFVGVVIGSVLFIICAAVMPEIMLGLLGPIAGFGLGLTGSYLAASVFNCFGALSTAQLLFGFLPAGELRIFNNGMGIIIALVIAGLLEIIWQVHHRKCVK